MGVLGIKKSYDGNNLIEKSIVIKKSGKKVYSCFYGNLSLKSVIYYNVKTQKKYKEYLTKEYIKNIYIHKVDEEYDFYELLIPEFKYIFNKRRKIYDKIDKITVVLLKKKDVVDNGKKVGVNCIFATENLEVFTNTFTNNEFININKKSEGNEYFLKIRNGKIVA